MGIEDLLQIGAQLFKGQLDKDRDGQLEIHEIAGALMSLMNNQQGGAAVASRQSGGQDGLSALVSGMLNGNTDLASLASSWLGQGPNAAVSGSQLDTILGEGNITRFAQQLGLNRDQAVSGLRAAVPDMVDKASPQGNINLESLSGLLGAAGKLFG